jgi:hypothetical protein
MGRTHRGVGVDYRKHDGSTGEVIFFNDRAACSEMVARIAAASASVTMNISQSVPMRMTAGKAMCRPIVNSET